MAGDISKSVNVAINVINGVSKQVGSIVASFGKITEGANKSAKAVGNLNSQLRNLKAPSGLNNLGKSLNSLSKVDSSGVTRLADGIKRLNGIKFPSFAKINSELTTHAQKVNDLVKAYNNLQGASSKVNLKAFTQNAATANKQVNKLGQNSQKTGASFSQWGYALGSASTGLSKFGTQIYGVTRGFSAVSKEMGLAMAAFTGAFATLFALKGVVKDMAEFDDAIRAAGAVAQASSVQLTQLSDAARAMGESTRYTAKDAAEALKALAMTGLDVNESIATLPTVLNLAAAANMDLGQSADIVTNIMVGYGKTVADLPHIADLMTAAFTNSNTSLQELGVALKYVGPVANAAGQSIEETTGILASLANAGYRGSKAGTTLRTAFSRLLAPTNKMNKVLDHYGIALSDLTNENGTMKSFTGILDLMGKKSITAGDALTIFGKRAGPGILALIGQGTPAIEEMNRKIAESEGTALKAAYEMESGLGGALRRLKSMWEEVSIAIGKTIEQDVQGFLEALTKSLKENKDQIVAVVSALFNFVSAVAKVVGWLTRFVAEHFAMLSALTAITVAMKLLSMTTKEFMAIGFVKYFATMFTGIKWSGIATGLTTVATGLKTYAGAAKGATAANAGQALTGLGAINFASIAGGLKNVGAALLSVGVNAGRAVIAFMAANPVILGLTVAIGGLLAVTKLLDNDYEGVAKSALKMATAAKEVNRELEYQLAELNLIDKEYKRDGATQFTDAEERLRDVIKKANISIEDRVKYLKKSREGTDAAKEAIAELQTQIEAEKKANDDKQIVKTTEARIAQSKAVEEQAKNLEYYYGISIDGQSRLNGLEKIAAATNQIGPILWLKKKLGYLDENINKYEELQTQQKVMEGNYQSMIAQMITAGKSTEEFNAALVASGAASEDVDRVTESYAKLKAEAESNKEVMDDLTKLSASAMEQLEGDASRKIEIFKSENKEREAIEKQTLYNIAVMEAQGVIDHETSEMAKLQATLTSSQARVDAAKKTYNSIDALAVDGREKAMEQIVAAEEAAAAVRLQILQKIAEAEKVVNEKITDLNNKRIDENSRSEAKLEALRISNVQKHKDAENTKTARIKEINETLNAKLIEIENKLADKRKQLAEDRVEVIRNATQRIKDIESSTEDKLRSIRQRGMTDRQKDNDNRKAANAKLAEGQRLVEDAKKTGDSAALARGTKLIEQSSDLFAGLSKQSAATNGVQKASEQLKEAEKVRAQIALEDIAKKVAQEEKAAARSRQIAKEAAANDKDNAKVSYDQKLQKADDFYQKEIKLENANHTKKLGNIQEQINKYDEKLRLIEKEKGLVLELITQQQNLGNTEAGSDVWTKANAATDEAIRKVDDYGKAVDGINDKEVNIKLTGEASPKAPLGEKLDEIKGKFAEISPEIIVNIKFVSDNVDLSTALVNLKSQIESLEINIPATVNMAQLDAAIKLINEYKKKDFIVDVKVNSGELLSTEAIYKKLVRKTVDIIIKVAGYDSLVKAKNMIDGIKSKTVTITTRHVDVKAKAMGGYIEPEHYATGGNVFKRLSSRFISSGGGKKDDVPAMLMKGEFVQKVDAVKKYGKNFMARLNAGLIPKSITQMFNQGGDVQPSQYAKGGHVGYSNVSSMLEFLPAGRRKKILDMFEDKLSKMGTSAISAKADSITTEIGQSSIAKMSDTIAGAVASFAGGGGINQLIADLANQKRDINSDYDSRISNQKANGSSEIAALLTREKESLLGISDSLKEELASLKAEYESYVAETTKSYNEEKEDRDSAYDKSSKNSKKSFDDENEDDDKQYAKDKEAYEKEKAAVDLEYQNKQAEMYQNIVSARIELQEKAKAIDKVGKFANEIGNINGGRRYTGDSTFYYKENFSPRKWYGDEKNPDRKMVEQAIQMGFTHGKLGLGEKGRVDATNSLEKAWAEFETAKSTLAQYGLENPVGILQDIEKINVGGAISRLKLGSDFKPKGSPLEDLAAALVASQKKEVLNGIDSNFGEVTNSYKETKDERRLAYNESSAEDKAAYNEESDNAKQSYAQSLVDAKAEYENSVKSATENSSGLSDEIKSTTSSDIESIKKSLDDNINELKSERDSQIRSLATKTSSDNVGADISPIKEIETPARSIGNISRVVSDISGVGQRSVGNIQKVLSGFVKPITNTSFKKSTPPIKNVSTTLLELLKRKYGIFGFNSGGYVNPTDTSVPGKDSILSALTPNEYVMKASVVRKFGKGFFDSLNNFRIPQFNSGGMVGNIGESLMNATSTEAVRHILDLSINGSKQGELTGSPMTIDKLLNDLTLAKLRS